MSYSIIFETKIVKLSDGRIIHFDRSGCNNDTVGRNKDEFTAKIYSVGGFMDKIARLQKDSKPIKECEDLHDWDLKINNRYATMYDYGAHLLRMFKRALSYSEFIKKYYFHAAYCTGIEVLEPEHIIMSLEEFDKYFYTQKRLRYRRIMEYPNIHNEKEIVSIIDNSKAVMFEIRK